MLDTTLLQPQYPSEVEWAMPGYLVHFPRCGHVERFEHYATVYQRYHCEQCFKQFVEQLKAKSGGERSPAE